MAFSYAIEMGACLEDVGSIIHAPHAGGGRARVGLASVGAGHPCRSTMKQTPWSTALFRTTMTAIGAGSVYTVWPCSTRIVIRGLSTSERFRRILAALRNTSR